MERKKEKKEEIRDPIKMSCSVFYGNFVRFADKQLGAELVAADPRGSSCRAGPGGNSDNRHPQGAVADKQPAQETVEERSEGVCLFHHSQQPRRARRARRQEP